MMDNQYSKVQVMLEEAALHHDIEGMRKALAMGADINHYQKDEYDENYVGIYGSAPVFLAARHTSMYGGFPLELGRFFVENGADMKVLNYDKSTVMILVARLEGLTSELVDFFVEQGIDVNARNDSGFDALTAAAKSGALTMDVLETLIRHGAVTDTEAGNEYDEDNETALDFMIHRDSFTTDYLERMIELGFKIHERHGHRGHGAFAAILSRRGFDEKSLEIVKKLISLGGDINIRDEYGRTVLHSLADNGIFSASREWGFNECFDKCGEEIMSKFAEAGMDFTATNTDGQNALMLLVMNRFELARETNISFIRGMLNNGIDINARDNEGLTAFMHAAASEKLTPDSLAKWASLGADINARDNEGLTAFLHAVTRGKLTPDSLEKWASLGVNINETDRNGNNAIALTIMSRHSNFDYMVQSICALVASGAGIKNMFPGWTPEGYIEWLKQIETLKSSRTNPEGKGRFGAMVFLTAALLADEELPAIENTLKLKKYMLARYMTPVFQYFPDREILFSTMTRVPVFNGDFEPPVKKMLVSIMLDKLDDNPALVFEFVRRHMLGNRLRLRMWAEDNVPGAMKLMTRLIPFIKQHGLSAKLQDTGAKKSYRDYMSDCIDYDRYEEEHEESGDTPDPMNGLDF